MRPLVLLFRVGQWVLYLSISPPLGVSFSLSFLSFFLFSFLVILSLPPSLFFLFSRSLCSLHFLLLFISVSFPFSFLSVSSVYSFSFSFRFLCTFLSCLSVRFPSVDFPEFLLQLSFRSVQVYLLPVVRFSLQVFIPGFRSYPGEAFEPPQDLVLEVRVLVGAVNAEFVVVRAQADPVTACPPYRAPALAVKMMRVQAACLAAVRILAGALRP